MKFGLNLQKKKTASVVRTSNAFGEDSEEEEMELENDTKAAKKNVNKQLSGYNKITKKVADEQAKALEEDPNIFDYDAVYDDLKEIENKKKEALKGSSSKKAKYISNLLEMAEIRKRDRLLAEEKKVAREREAEGSEFADKEVFVTETFKKQKEELERIEREEREREAFANKAKGMDSFYKQVLEKKEAEHQAMMKALSEKKERKNDGKSEELDEVTDIKLAKEAMKEGKDVLLNDNNEIVDKRQLLGAGLNVKPRFGTLASLADSDTRIKERMDEYEAYKRKKLEEYESKRRHGKNSDERERLSKEIERQMLETKQKEKEAEEKKQKELEEKAAVKRTTEDAALSARERYLARKKQKLESGNQ
ncbi:coiled-coil domain-containing protein 55-domain containing protein [Pilobolus umbonatus]|nr:coiled-coil domain-containing protein 55-domain containing protein [Pilobolus umbonatus]